MITRTAMTDDDGSLTTGTIFNNAWKTALYDEIDARWSRHTSTLTGAQNNLDVDEADLVLLNGASAGAFTGLAAPASPAKPGKITIFKNIHATSAVTFAHNSGSSSAGNKFFNVATSGPTPVFTGGWIAYQYDDVNSRWNLVGHDQGAWITPTFAAGNFTGNGSMTWTVEAGDVIAMAYRLAGRTLSLTFQLNTTSVGGTPNTFLQIGNGAWGAFTANGSGFLPLALFKDNAVVAPGYMQSLSTTLYLTRADAAVLTASTNATYTFGTISFEVG